MNMSYLDYVDQEMRKYFEILEPNFPEWLNDYIFTKEMRFLDNVSITCGTIYSDLFDSEYNVSTLEHSVAVALIVWHFTHDKKQTLAGLFHDIATPVFKHCIDYLYGDAEKQEATEELTTKIIENSSEIMALLKRDKIKVEEVNDYHKYPIADNDTPQLSADRLEYSLANGLFIYELANFNEINEIYEDLSVCKNETGGQELGFKSLEQALNFVQLTSKLSKIYREDRTRYSMQLIADIVKHLHDDNMISIEDLYCKSEKEVIELIKNSKYADIFKTWQNAERVKSSLAKPNCEYFVKVGAKVRWINPLVNGERIYNISAIAKQLIDDNLSYKMDNYIWLDGIKF